MFEHTVNVDGPAIDRLLAEDFHAVDQVANSIGFVADEVGQFAVGRQHVGFEQLGGAANTGERVLDLVGQDRGHAADAAGGAPIGDLTIQRAGGRGVL